MAPSDSPLEARQLKLIVDAIPALVSYVDDLGRYQFNNKAYEDWFGHSAEALRGRHLKELLGAAAYERVRPHVEAALAGQRTEFEGQVPYKDGGTRFIRAQYVPDFRADGSVAGYFALINDVTHRVEAERALKESEHRFRDTADAAPATQPRRAECSRSCPTAAFPLHVSHRADVVVRADLAHAKTTARRDGAGSGVEIAPEAAFSAVRLSAANRTRWGTG